MKFQYRLTLLLSIFLIVCVICFPAPLFAELPFSGLALSGAKEPPGAKIVEILPDSPAAGAGLLVGDVIVEIEGKNIKSLEDFIKVSKKIGDMKGVLLSVMREDKALNVTIGVRPTVKKPVPKKGSLLEMVTKTWDWTVTDPETGVRFFGSKGWPGFIKGGRQAVAIGEIPHSLDLANHDVAKKLLIKGKDLWLYKHTGYAGRFVPVQYKFNGNVHVQLYQGPFAEERDEDVSAYFIGEFSDAPVENRQTLMTEEGKTLYINGFDAPKNYVNRLAEAREKQETHARTEAAANFVQQYNVQRVVDPEKFALDPFIHKGEIIAIPLEFSAMKDENNALFITKSKEPLIVSSVKGSTFTENSTYTLAVRVTGFQRFRWLAKEMFGIRAVPRSKLLGYASGDLTESIAEILKKEEAATSEKKAPDNSN
jgi:hypothetical protein